jgi:integrating conjugative element protein (TIGR03749 family)
MIKCYVTCIGALAALALGSTAHAVERIIWNKEPVSLHLTVDQERLVTFPASVHVGVQEGMAGVLRTQVVDGTVYWKATRAFPVLRVQVQELESGRIFLVDLKADKTATSSEPVEVAVPASSASTGARDGDRAAPATPAGGQIGYVKLTRFAAQQLYAPTRLVQPEAGISPVALRTEGAVRLILGRNAGAVEAIPIESWRSANFYVTAIRLRNLGTSAITIDPRELRGRWLAATPQHGRLLPAGDDADTSALYLISSRSFEESL